MRTREYDTIEQRAREIFAVFFFDRALDALSDVWYSFVRSNLNPFLGL